MSEQKNLRESLFEAEPLAPDRLERFRNEIAGILEPRLPRSHRLYYVFAAISSLIGALGAVPGLYFDSRHRWLWGLELPLLLACAGWCLHILRRGAEPIRTMQSMSKALAGIGAVVAAGIIIYALRNPSLAGVLWGLLGLLFCVFTSVINLWNRFLIAERSTKEHVLRVEYRLAEFASRSEMPGAQRGA